MTATQRARRPDMNHTTTHTPPSHRPAAAAATVTDLLQPPLTTAGRDDHLAAAAYLMKHASTTALLVTDTHTGQPAGIITRADITRAIANGKDPDTTRIHAAMTTRPAIATSSSIRDAAEI